MRLLHTRYITFKDFFDDQIPAYAILSHRWSHQEVSYQAFFHERKDALEGRIVGYGWTKILKACEIARSFPTVDWIWIDTSKQVDVVFASLDLLRARNQAA